jgi:hypothetical protein
MPEGNPLAIFAPGLNRLGVPWMAVGSIASSAYGEPRSTLDVDVVAVVGKQEVGRFLVAFPEADFYCPPMEVIQAEAARSEHGHFNLIHHHSIYKADIYLATESAFERWAFANRRPLVTWEIPVWLAPPEYIIVHKLEFFREGGSETHLRDIRGMLAVTEIDRAFLEREIEARQLQDAWCTIKKGG